MGRRSIPIGMVTSGKKNCQSGSLIFFYARIDIYGSLEGLRRAVIFGSIFPGCGNPERCKRELSIFFTILPAYQFNSPRVTDLFGVVLIKVMFHRRPSGIPVVFFFFFSGQKYSRFVCNKLP